MKINPPNTQPPPPPDTNVISLDEYVDKVLLPAMNKLVDEIYPFEAWWNGADRITVRSSRAFFEVRTDPNHYLEGWMRAAFDAGFEAAQASKASGST